MILGFVFFWPIGLAIVMWKIWQKRTGYPGDLMTFVQERINGDWRENMMRWKSCSARGFDRGFGFGTSGNTAFDDWRNAELARLEEERRKLADAEREFGEFLNNLRRAKDREEFDRFMRERPSRASGEGPQPSA
jgi:hypothetical protein